MVAEAPTALERAKHLCGSRPIRAKCLAAALHRREPWGVWGGELFERGTIVTHKRPRGRPRRAGLRRHEALQPGHVAPSGRS
ncbi:MAG: WhiB family transcriptional regulator [Pseudonocardiales bacterium]|nr:WhiB family transcriptional regulator [Pseudonocardiales bacterium]